MPNEVDVIVGQRIRDARIVAGLSQTALAKASGVSYQQIQKYEAGATRISSSRLAEVSHALRVPVAEFFRGLGYAENPAEAPPSTTLPDENGEDRILPLAATRVAAAWMRIKDKKTRKYIRDMIVSLANQTDD